MKSVIIWILILLAWISLSAQSPDWQWVAGYGDWNNDTADDIVIDPQGSVYTVGIMGSSLSFGSNYLDAADGAIFVTKHSSIGTLIWAVNFGGGVSEFGNAGIALDNSGNIFVQSHFTGTGQFGSTTITSWGQQDIVVAKLNNEGQMLWASRAGSGSYDYPRKIDTDSNGDAYVTGITHNGIFGDFTLSGTWQGYIAKISSTGTWLWAKSYTSSSTSFQDIAVDSNNNVWAVGSVQGNVSFGSYSFTTNGFGVDLLVVNLDSAGNWLGYQRSSGSAHEYSTSIAIDALDNVIVGGYFTGSYGQATFGTWSPAGFGSMSVFIAKFSGGAWSWAKSGGGAASSSSYLRGLGTDPSGNVYATGSVATPGSFGDTTLSGYGGSDVFVVSLDSGGDWRWASAAGSSGFDSGQGIVASETDLVYVAGFYKGEAHFGDITYPAPGGFNYENIFIGRFGFAPPAAPKEPANLSLSRQNGDLILSWDAVTQDINDQPVTISGYKVYYHTGPEGDFTLLGETGGLQFTITGPLVEDKRFYFVTAEAD